MPHKARKWAADIGHRHIGRGRPRPRILIVCEGKKTEPYYFMGIRDFYGLIQNVVIMGSGANPTNIVKLAKEKYEESQKGGVPFDQVFCVFDKNSHPDYPQALAQLKNKDNFVAIASVPCFEYWLLLHYHRTTKPYQGKDNKSACDQVISDLAEHIPHYRKGGRNTFSQVQGKLGIAITNAKTTLEAAQKSGTDNPSTNVHLLVEHLQNLAGN